MLADCDVDAADLHLLLQPVTREQREFWSGQVAHIEQGKCIQCGFCQELCRFDAIRDFVVDPVSCEGCGFCSHVCAVEAITMKDNLSGHLFVSETRYGPLVHARLGAAQDNSGKLVALVRQQARKLAQQHGAGLVVSDGPPGIGCPVISSLSGVDAALLVTEPTLSAMHDLERVLGVCRHFGVFTMVCINKWDINEDNAREIELCCANEGIAVAGRIPFDSVVTEAMVHGLPVVEYSRNGVSRQIEALWKQTVASLHK